MKDIKFDIRKLEKLNHPERITDINPSFIWEKIALKNPEIIADIGAGTGLFAKEFSKLSPQSKILALDISTTMIDWMNTNICHEFSQITTQKMEETMIYQANESVDVVIMINLHHELHDSMAMIKECNRILKPEGKIAICDWKKMETPKGPPLEIRYTPEEVESELTNNGFSNIQIFDELKNNWLVIAVK